MRTTRSCPVLLVALLVASVACSSNSDHAPRPDPTPDARSDAPQLVLDGDPLPPPPPDAPVSLDAGDCVLGTAWPFGDAMCTACVQDNCCEQVNGCENDATCMAYANCRLGCALAGQNCLNQCDAMYPTAIPAFNTFTMCIAHAPCQSVCQ